MRTLATVLLIALVFAFSSPAYSTKMTVPPTITFTWDGDTTGKVDGYRLYIGRTSRYDESLTPIIDEHINTHCGQASTPELVESCIDSWDGYCGLADIEYGDTPDPRDYRVCDADYYMYDSSIDLGYVTETTITPDGYGVWYFTIVSYDNEATYNFFAAEPPESRFSVELMQVVSPPEVPKPEPECPADLDGDGDVDGTDLVNYDPDTSGVSPEEFAESFGSNGSSGGCFVNTLNGGE